MTEENYNPAVYQPDTNLARKRDVESAKPKPTITVDKPVAFRVGKVTTRPPTVKHHYPRKGRKWNRPDLRNPTYY